MSHPTFGVVTFSDAQLQDELDFARLERASGGPLGQRDRVASRIKALECEQMRRMWEAGA